MKKAPPPKIEGVITRGTTGINRLRRSDRWIVHNRTIAHALNNATDPLIVDLGYGARPDTTFEMASRLTAVRRDRRVIGLEIDPARVVESRDGVSFARGGFELAGLTPVFVRAFNVLRQYPEELWTLRGHTFSPVSHRAGCYSTEPATNSEGVALGCFSTLIVH